MRRILAEKLPNARCFSISSNPCISCFRGLLSAAACSPSHPANGTLDCGVADADIFWAASEGDCQRLKEVPEWLSVATRDTSPCSHYRRTLFSQAVVGRRSSRLGPNFASCDCDYERQRAISSLCAAQLYQVDEPLLAGSFVALVGDQAKDQTMLLEDGFVVMMTKVRNLALSRSDVRKLPGDLEERASAPMRWQALRSCIGLGRAYGSHSCCSSA
jgi:hypothetical protein